MEITKTQTAKNNRNNFCSQGETDQNGGFGTEERLNFLLSANAEISRRKLLYRSHQEELEAALMKHPISTEKAFSYLGFLLGAFPPAAIFLKFALSINGKGNFGLLFLLLFVNLICAVVGWITGKYIGRTIRDMETRPWSTMLVVLPLIGALWGIITGGAGGLIVFVIGAVFGGIIAAVVGSVAFPIFAIFHRWLKKGEMIENSHFMPIAFGIVFVISALILGL